MNENCKYNINFIILIYFLFINFYDVPSCRACRNERPFHIFFTTIKPRKCILMCLLKD